MFVRWKARIRRYSAFGYDHDGDVHWAAVLVESTRIKGKPVPRHVAYLGGITESAIKIVPQQCHFWRGVEKHLDRLANRVSPEGRQRIAATIQAKVSRPTEQEFKQLNEWLVANGLPPV